MSRAPAAITFAVVLAAGLALAVSPSPGAPGARRRALRLPRG